MLSPKTQERLNQAIDDTAASAKVLRRLVGNLNAHAERLGQDVARACGDADDTRLRAGEVAHLLRLNRNLAKAEHFLKEMAAMTASTLDVKLNDPIDPMGDYEIDAELHYTLREGDPDWSDDNDNFLTHREVSLKHELPCYADGTDHRKFLPGMKRLNTEAHCWSFHDLWDHDYGPKNPRVPLRDCLRLGSVWIDVVIRQQYWLNLDTGEWEKGSAPSPEESDSGAT